MNTVAKVILYGLLIVGIVLAVHVVKTAYRSISEQASYQEAFVSSCSSNGGTERQCACVYSKAKDQAGGHREIAAYLNNMSEGTMGLFVQSCL